MPLYLCPNLLELMMSESLVVIGAGGHAKVVISALFAAGYNVTAIYDDDLSRQGQFLQGIEIQGSIADIPRIPNLLAIIGVGDNISRRRISKQLCGMRWLTVIHPSAWVDPSVRLGVGTVICAGAIVQSEATIGDHVIINTGAIIEHDCQLGNYVHVAPRASLAGGVSVEEGSLVGIGSTVIPGRRIGRWGTIGAGGVVIRDIPPFSIAVGVPAQVKSYNKVSVLVDE